MQDFKIDATKKSPEIVYNSKEQSLIIIGRSVMSNMDDDFYQPVFDLFDLLQTERPGNFTLELNLEYFNTSSHLSIIKMLKGIDSLTDVGITTNVVWAHDAEDVEMKEIGQEMQKFCNTPFDYKALV